VSRRPRFLLAVAMVAGLIVAGVGCGKKAPPVAPEKRLPAAPTAMSATVEANAIVLDWSIPKTRVDGTPLRDLAVVRLHRRAEGESEPAKSAMVSARQVVGWDEVAAIKLDAPGPAVVAGNSIKWTDRQGLVVGRRYIYVATVEDSTGRWSAPSERLSVLYLAAPRPPQALAVVAGDREVRLTWEPPPGLIDGSPLRGELTYVILRGTGAEGPLAAVTGEPVAGPETLSEEILAKNTTDPAGEALRRPLIDDYYRERMVDFAKIEAPLLSAANWGGQGLHPRGNFVGYEKAVASAEVATP